MNSCALLCIYRKDIEELSYLGEISFPVKKGFFTSDIRFIHLTNLLESIALHIVIRLKEHYATEFCFSIHYDHSLAVVFEYKVHGSKLSRAICESGLLNYIKQTKKRLLL